MESTKPSKTKCPTCGRLVPYENNPYRPFCSRGCKGLDLIRWSDESYRIQKDEEDKEEHEDTE